MPPKQVPEEEQAAAAAVHRAQPQVTPAFLKEVLQKSTAASDKATRAMQDTLLALPTLLANALEKRDQVAAGGPPPELPSSKLHDRKVPDFWETKPTSWFHVFESHLDKSAPQSEKNKFALLLPLLTTNAVEQVDRLVRAPPEDVYTVAQKKLLAHFERDPLEMATELLNLTSLGDRSAESFLEYMRSLQPGEPETTLFRCIFLRCLPRHICTVVAHHKTLDAMAIAADIAIRTTPEISSLSINALGADHPRDKLIDGLCAIHAKYGRDSYNCLLSSCRMKNILKKKSGNAPAGRR